MSTPRITVVLPTFNTGRYVGLAIESVLCQTCGDFELLVLDNVSTDDTPRVVAGFSDERLVYRRNAENLGFVGNVSLGLQLARGEFIAFMGADDLWKPRFLEKSCAHLVGHPKMSLTHTAAVFIDETGAEFGQPMRGQWQNVMSGADAFMEACRSDWQFPAVLARTELARRAGGFDPKWQDFSDFCLFLRLCLQGDVGYIDERLLKYRVHREGLSAGHFRDGGFSRNWVRCAREACSWPEAVAAGIPRRQGEMMESIASTSIAMSHLVRKHGSRWTFVKCFCENVAVAPQVLLRPATWLRFALGLLPREVIFKLQNWKRRRWNLDAIESTENAPAVDGMT